MEKIAPLITVAGKSQKDGYKGIDKRIYDEKNWDDYRCF